MSKFDEAENTGSLLDIVEQGNLSSVSDEIAVRTFGEQFNPELRRLQNAKSTIETGDGQPRGSLGQHAQSPSRLLFGVDYAEINRTLVSILALKWLIARDYDSFTAHQPPALKLRAESFCELSDLVIGTVSVSGQQLALIIAVMVNDLGKDPDLLGDVEKRIPKLASNLNHDEVVHLAATLDIVSSLSLLCPDLKEDVILGLHAGSKLNIPQLAQAENVPGSLEGALLFKSHQRAFDIKYLETMLDVAGAGGHIDARAPVRLIEPVYRAFAVCRTALLEIILGSASLREGYDLVLQHRSRLLEMGGFRMLTTSSDPDRALLRMLAMGRVVDKEKADLFASAFTALPENTRERLVNGLSVDGYGDGEAVILYYVPALFAEILRSTKSESEETKIAALTSLMHFMARAYRHSAPQHGKEGSVTVHDVSFAERVVRSESFKADPRLLDCLDV